MKRILRDAPAAFLFAVTVGYGADAATELDEVQAMLALQPERALITAARLSAQGLPAPTPAPPIPEIHVGIARGIREISAFQANGDWIGGLKLINALLIQAQNNTELYLLNSLKWQFSLLNDTNPNFRTETLGPLREAIRLSTTDITTKEAMERMLRTEAMLTGALAALQTQPRLVATVQPAQKIVAAPASTFTHIVVIVDTSDSMRDANGRLQSAAVMAVRDTLGLFPAVRGVRVMDADGRIIVPVSGDWAPNAGGFQPPGPSTLMNDPQRSGKDPTVALSKALDLLNDPSVSLYICVIGDELVLSRGDPTGDLADKNPLGLGGARRARIGALQLSVPGTTTPSPGSLRFQSLMGRLATASGGAVTPLPADATSAPAPVRLF